MKKTICLLILLISISGSVFGQITGTGTFENPYKGTIWSSSYNYTIDGTSYFDQIDVFGGTLTIIKGSTLFGVSATSYIQSFGDGSISAVGDANNLITFSADNDGNGSHQEIEKWGNIGFFYSSAQSIIEYAIIESGTSDGYYHGGGIDIFYGDNIAIRNSTVRNCSTLGSGGGIYVLPFGNNVILENLKIYDNTASLDGGGLYIDGNIDFNSVINITGCEIFNNSAANGSGVYVNNTPNNTSTISNSLIYNNSGDGVYFNSTGNVVNCNIVNNTTGITTASSVAPIIENSVIWGNGTQISSGSSAILSYCGVQGGYSGTGDINLSATNGDPTGPNFFDPTATVPDYSIKFISPCRDAGTSTGAPTDDYLGKLIIGTKDIGAYEVQYSRWTGGANDNTWSTSSNWDKSVDPPIGTGDIIIPSGLTSYPTSSSSPDYSIGTGKYMIIEPGAQVTLGTLTNNGTLNLESSSSGIFSLMLNSYTGSGTANVEMYLTGGGGPAYNWHYVAVPADYSKTVFTSINAFNLLLYNDSYVSTSTYEGWVWHDGFVESTGLLNGPSFSDLVYGAGYNFYHNQTAGFATATFSVSTLGTTLPTVTPSYNGPADDNLLFGLNLLGNSLTCSIDWDQVIRSGNIRDAIYFTSGNQMVSYVDGVGVPAGTTGIIPPLQGFFIQSQSATDVSIDFSGTDVKTHGTVNRYKKGSVEIIPLVRLQLLNGSKVEDETVVRLDNKATPKFDNSFDASKLFSGSIKSSQLYTQIDNEKYVINAIPFPSESYTVPVAVKVTSDGNYQIQKTQLQELDNYKVTLKDNLTGFTADLKTTPNISFSASAGLVTDRFVLTISNIPTGIEDHLLTTSLFNIFSSNNQINIQTAGDEWDGKSGSIKVMDLTGKVVSYLNNTEFWKNSIIQIPATVKNGIYFVEMSSGNLRYVGKVVIK